MPAWARNADLCDLCLYFSTPVKWKMSFCVLSICCFNLDFTEIEKRRGEEEEKEGKEKEITDG